MNQQVVESMDAEEPAVLMPVRQMREEMRRKTHRWAVVLENFDGRQNPSCLSKSIITQTGRRISQCIPDERTLFILRQEYLDGDGLSRYPRNNVMRQPSECGTLTAVLWSLLHLSHLDPEAVVAFFPLGTGSAEETRFTRAVGESFDIAQSSFCQDSIVVLGASAERLEPDHGWIEPKPSLLGCSGGIVRQVLRFSDQPSQRIAPDLAKRGCLVNTSVMVGRVASFLNLVGCAEPALLPPLQSAWKGENLATWASRYTALAVGSFANRILTRCAEKLLVLPVPEMVWGQTEVPLPAQTSAG